MKCILEKVVWLLSLFFILFFIVQTIGNFLCPKGGVGDG